jgi:hypothetical protein
MTDNIISFEEFRPEKKKAESENDPIMQVLKKDLREQEDLVDWYLFHSSFNKYKLFLHSLFYNNHERLKGSNPNAEDSFKFLMKAKSTLSQAARKKH